MKRLPLRAPSALLLGLLLAACSPGDVDVGGVGHGRVAHDTPMYMRHPFPAPPRAGIASQPNLGDLLRYPPGHRADAHRVNASFPVSLSEAHAYAAIGGGDLVVTAPDGGAIRLRAQRHEEYPDGNWTLVARSKQGDSALLTFGQDAVFGSVTRPDGSLLQITTRHRQVYLTEIDARDQARFGNPRSKRGTDVVVPPHRPIVAASIAEEAAPDHEIMAGAAATASNSVDVLLGYSGGLATRIGSDSGAVTRMQNLVAVTNEAYQNSGVTMRLTMVHAMRVEYTDNNTNQTALQALTGSTGSGSAPIDPAFNALRAAREQYGADLVSLVRQFREPENDGCGIAWLLGGGRSSIDQGDALFGYSVSSDGSDVRESDGRTYFCRDETFAHELGHNLGQAHNQEDSSSAGAHAYSYGYRESSPAGFFTIMAYRIPDSSQFSIRYFANPDVSYSGRPTGIAGTSNNTLSMNMTMPIIASFRGQATPAFPLGALVGQNGKCLDATGRGTGNGTPMQMYACNFESQQLWRWNPIAGPADLIGEGSIRALDVAGFGTANGSQLQLWDAGGSANQRWSMANFGIVGIGSGRVLDVRSFSSANGAQLQLWDDNRTANQLWNFNAGDRSIRGIGGKCLDVAGFSTANGALVQLWDCNGTTNQQWSLGANGIIVGIGGKCLEAAEARTGNGTTLRMWDCIGGSHQAWKLRGEVRSQASNRCLDDSGNGAVNGARAQIWDCHGRGNQRWEFAWR